MWTHIKRTVSGYFAALRQLRQIRNSVPTAKCQSLVVALVQSRFDYGNSVLIGLSIHMVRRLQSVQNAAARLICRLRRSDHVTDALVSLHWLHAPEYVPCRTLNVSTEYFGPVVRVDDLPGQQSLRSAGTRRMVVPPFNCQQLTLELTRWPVLASGIVCQQTLHRHLRCRPSAND